MLQREAAAGPDLRFVAGGQLDRESGRHQLRLARRERDGFDAVQVHPGVLFGTVRVTRDHRVGMKPS